ncbi:MAG: ABC transporter ATP-binding protein [Ruminococcaceae bacterium]|nr:ABC transporter ATP-binding protein [Oscillospiraceae bacterium]
MGILLEKISLSFDDKVIFTDFSYEFADSGVTCIMGPSGRGKTTLLRIVCGLQKPDSGSVYSCEKTSVMFQEDRLMPWLTAGENITAVCDCDPLKYLAMVGLAGEKDTMPDQLSGGMARRVALARALAYDGDVLLLDEPFKGLDDELRIKMYGIIAETAKSKPVIMATHNEDDAKALNAEILRL